MAIDTNAEKLAVMEWDEMYEPAIPLSPGATFEQGEKQNLIWGFPGVSWATVTGVARSLVDGSLAIGNPLLRSLTS